MRVAIAYPPFTKDGTFPLLTQNRQFKYTASREVRIYPMIPAMAATILKEAGHDVLFLDGMNQRLSLGEFNSRLLEFSPELVVFDTKAPLLKRHWEYLDWLKSKEEVTTVLVGDHITFY
ncbi:MAG: B12-binding domain-containing radical SAM protein, partial [Chloroflexota bacterium]